MIKKYSGQCACGAVRFGFDVDPHFVAVCHCLDCKKASGSEAMTYLAISEEDFTLLSGKPNSFHYVAASGKGLDKNFCPDCGARLFTRNVQSLPGTIFVTLGSLDHPEGIVPTMEIFTTRRLDWAVPLDVPQFDAMPG
ncbi:GFA family protein [Ancylobacter terrae]|uniref:GFA family protein n=1 Tax=Ancylobacter sp. sgz301288 TaxID=3342077 RepID=UPI003858E19F